MSPFWFFLLADVDHSFCRFLLFPAEKNCNFKLVCLWRKAWIQTWKSSLGAKTSLSTIKLFFHHGSEKKAQISIFEVCFFHFLQRQSAFGTHSNKNTFPNVTSKIPNEILRQPAYLQALKKQANEKIFLQCLKKKTKKHFLFFLFG